MDENERERLVFISTLKERLKEPSESWNGGYLTLSGILPLDHRNLKNTHVFVPVQIGTIGIWQDGLPKILPDQSYLYKKCEDWHIYEGNYLCYLLDLDWLYKGKLMCESFPRIDVARNMAQWACDAAALLLYRHRQGKKLQLDGWRQEWDEYKHREAGIEQFYQEHPDARKYLPKSA